MIRRWKNVVCMLVAAIMLCCFSLGGQVLAAENSIELQNEVYYDAGDTSQGNLHQSGWFEFRTFEELKELTNGTYTGTVAYVSSEPLVIKEDLIIPENLSLYGLHLSKTLLIVPEGVTLTLPSNSYLDCYSIDVQGTLIVNSNITVHADGILSISGVLQNNAYIDLFWCGVMCLEDGGSYRGPGTVYAQYDELDEYSVLSNRLVGFDIDKFEEVKHNDGYPGGTWSLRNMLVQFEDVVAGAYYEEPVRWAVKNNITNGYGSEITFCPDVTCTRGQVVTFLWRAKGCPEPASTVNPFTDIKESDYFYKAVLWAVENGITAGYGSDSVFNPDGACTRGQVATFLWRAEGKPSMSSTANPFTDVASDQYYYDAVLWAVENGVTNGYGGSTTFAPDVICNRGQIVTFLYRAEE